MFNLFAFVSVAFYAYPIIFALFRFESFHTNLLKARIIFGADCVLFNLSCELSCYICEV